MAGRALFVNLSAALVLVFVSAAAVSYFSVHGWLLYYGDAEAHLNIARRIFDSQTPGYSQIGMPWLPLPHALMLPFVAVDGWWRSGIAGAIPSACCFVAGAMLFFGATQRIFGSLAAAIAATALLACNPNMLYLQSIPMTEAVFFCCLMGLLYCSVRFRETQSWAFLAGAGIAAGLGTLTRYDGWFLLPFAALYFLIAARRRRIEAAIVFSAIAALGPLYWFGHNWLMTGDPLDFYRGPNSAKAIQHGLPYPGKGDWRIAFLYYRTAASLCAGPGLALMGAAGIVVALARRAFWPVALLLLPGVFYVWQVHSFDSPIHLPMLPPYSYYNSRYGLAVLPLLALAAAALVTAVPLKMRAITAFLVIAAGSIHWIAHPGPENWITWTESRVNSDGRRAWMNEAAAHLRPRYVRGSGIISSAGDDFFGIYRVMGIPLRETFSVCNGLAYLAALRRQDPFLWHEWAVVRGGDETQKAVVDAARYGIRYRLELRIEKKDEPVIEIYRRIGGAHGPA